MPEEREPSIEERLAKASLPGKTAPSWHAFYRGKVETALKCPVESFDDFGIWYTPGVAAPCREIHADPDKVFHYTNKSNAIAVVSDGSRVLGLGNIGPQAALPVMEGKALLFKYLGGVGAFPIVLDTQDPDEIVQAVKWMAPGFGGINLEDIASPKCFYVLDRLRQELEIPVWHDDQQGTAAVTLAALVNGLKVVGKRLEDSIVALFGVGAAGAATLRVLAKAGLPSRPSPRGRPRRRPVPHSFVARWISSVSSRTGVRYSPRRTRKTFGEASPRPSLGRTPSSPSRVRDRERLEPRWFSAMREGSVALLMANPVPEVWPWEAKAAGVRVVGTGRSDFPNQVNNSIGFPGIFRGTLDVQATTITDEMTIAAARAIAKTAERTGLSEDHIVPTMMETDVFIDEAVAVGLEAVRQGIARRALSEKELRREAETSIRHAQEETKILMRAGHIPPPPDSKRA